MRWNHLAFSGLLVLGGCGGSSEPADEEAPAHAGGEAHHHHGAGHHGAGHDHSSPAALRPLMRQLYGDMGELRAALDGGDVAAAATHARAIAVACDDQDVHHVDPEVFGPRFAEIDAQLHGAAAEMATAAEAGELEPARARYAELHAACVACHAQAPSAAEVDVSSLAPLP